MLISHIKNSPDLFQRTAGGGMGAGVAVVILVVGVINTELRVTSCIHLIVNKYNLYSYQNKKLNFKCSKSPSTSIHLYCMHILIKQS